MLRTILFASVAIAFALGFQPPAHAQWTGSSYGNQTYWNNSQTGRTTVCSRYGNQTYCN